MSAKRIFGLIVTVALLLSSTLTAQIDPFGIQDTIGVEITTCPRGSKVVVDIYLNNDEALKGVSVPLRFSSNYLICDSVIFSGTKLESVVMKQSMINNDSGYVLLGGLVISEDPISTGPGILAKLAFEVSHDAPEGLEIVIDSGFIAPAGEMVLTMVTAEEIFPAFRSGKISVTNQNLPPVFKPIPRQYVTEGEELNLTVEAFDRERDEYELSVSRLPQGAHFDSESGIFHWTPPYLGSHSAAGNPFNIVFIASDGTSSAHMQVEVEVLNKNRLPVLSMINSYEADAGDVVEILVAAEDPDLEDVQLNIENLPSGCSFNNQNPGLIRWESAHSDSGLYALIIEATDPNGASASEELNLKLNSVSTCDLILESEQAYLGATVTISVDLNNRVAINSMYLLIKYDPTALELMTYTNASTRTEDWERYFITHDEFEGKIWVNGVADLPGGGEEPSLPVGEGSILHLDFRASADQAFAGLLIPVTFAFIDSINYTDNTMTDSSGQLIGQEQISYTNGSIFIKQYDGLIGDINLNGLEFEISDLVYFTNYFIDPLNFPLDGARWQNSDVNQDARPGTIADLVYLVRIISGDIEPSGKYLVSGSELSSEVKIKEDYNRIKIYSDWEDELGGALLRFNCSAEKPEVNLSDRTSGLTLNSSFTGNILTVLICDPNGSPIRSGDGPMLDLVATDADLITLESAELSDIHGNMILTKINSGIAIPESFELGQNYPNPFNPTTTISFGLPSEARINLKIYNIRGQLIDGLIDDVLEAGYHEIEWNGCDRYGQKVSSGVYFYKITAGEFSESKKMIMLK
jgi:Secretion system C-terminal sorting domain/Putative Ig domain